MRLLTAPMAVAVLLASACSAAVPPLPTAAPQPTADVQATVNAAVVGTVTALAAPVMATATAQAAAPTAVPTRAVPKLTIDASRYLGSYPAGVDPLADSQAMSAIVMRDSETLDRLRMAGRVYDVFSGDQVEEVDSIGSYSRVKVITGNAAGKTVLVPHDMIARSP